MSRAIVIGGGFYGASIALYLKTMRSVESVTLFERSPVLLGRASFTNQARVHCGYHYPRSFTTAYRSVVNAPRFVAEFKEAIVSEFTSLYALARRNTKITPRQMERFCGEIGASLAPASDKLTRLFNGQLIERVYEAKEPAFDASILREIMTKRLGEAGVEVHCNSDVQSVSVTEDGVCIGIKRDEFEEEHQSTFAFNCTYSRLEMTLRGTSEPCFGLKHELAEMVLVEPPSELERLGITIMDGPFFSFMPFPPRGLHSLSHVRYTPHLDWVENRDIDPYNRLALHHAPSRADRMLRDAARYVPSLSKARVVDSMMEVKTVLTRSESDDGRPILLRRDQNHGRVFSILGGKIDNVYDIIELLDNETFPDKLGSKRWTH